MDNLDESLLTKNNLELNLDKWTNGTILYITGISGSGKTTLAKKIATESNAEYLELDIFCMFAKRPKDKCIQNLMKTVKDFYHLDDTFYNFLENYVKNLPDTEFNYIPSTKDLSNESFAIISNNAFNFIKAAEDFLSKNKINSKYIFEGCQIALMDPEYFKDKPLIIKNTGFIKSVYRTTSRTIKNSSSFDKMLKSVFARLAPGSLKSLHRLDKIKDNFVDSLNESNVEESDINMKLLEEYQLFESRLPQDGSDPEFGLPDKKKFPLYDEAHVKSAIKFFNYAEGEDKIKLAKAIKTKMDKYGIRYDTVGDDNNLKRYLTEFYNYILTEVKVNVDNIKNKVQPRPGESDASYTNRLNQQIYCVKKSKEKKQKQLAAQAAKNTYIDDRNIHKDNIKPGNPENQDYTIDERDDDRTYGNIKSMNESVLDPINKERCKDIFKNDKMISSARKFILDILADFKHQVNFPFEVKNIYMIGSSTGFQYSATSDIDIEVETNIPKNKMRQIINIIPKGTFLPGTQKPINLFVLEDGNSYNFDYAENVYDIKGNKWLKQTEKSNHNIPYQYIKDLSQFFMNGCDLTLSKFNQDKKEIQEYMGLDPKVQEISEKEKAEAIDRKINDIKNDIDAITMAHHVIFSFEQEGYNDMPFKLRIDMDKNDDPRYSVNNLVYKMIDRFGYLDKLNDAKKEAANIVKEAEKHVD